MLHQTLISSPSVSLLFNNVCTSYPPPPPLHSSSPLGCFPATHHCSKVETEQGMMNFKADVLYSGEEQGMESWGVEKCSGFGDGFSVEDLLDLGDFGDNNELESEEFGEQMESEDNNNTNNNSCSSALSFDLPPPPSLDDIPLPAHDAADLEWVSLIIDDTLSDIPSCSGVPPPPALAPTTTTKVASLTTPTLCALSTEAPVPVRAKRSKRPRTTSGGAAAPSAASWSIPVRSPLLSDSSSSSAATTTTSSSSVSSCLIYSPAGAGAQQSYLLYGPAPPTKKPKLKKRGRRPKSQLPPPPAASGERRCSHCGVQKTPQWRAGPFGAKTLCNACGVRFKSGRLLPEYRPACSPTFVSSIHSNSHRKVLEMRRKNEAEFAAAPPVAASC